MKKRRTKKKKREFSKLLIVVVSAICVCWITASYVLAAFDKQGLEMVTCAIIGAWLGSIVMYLIKALQENKSKYGRSGRVENKLEAEVEQP